MLITRGDWVCSSSMVSFELSPPKALVKSSTPCPGRPLKKPQAAASEPIARMAIAPLLFLVRPTPIRMKVLGVSKNMQARCSMVS